MTNNFPQLIQQDKGKAVPVLN